MKLTTLLLFVLITVSAFSQGFNNATSGFTASIQKTNTGQVEDIIDTLYNQTCVLQMVNASLIKEVTFILDDDGQGVKLYETHIDLNSENTLPEGVTYQLQGNQLRISIGAYAQTRKLKYTFSLKDLNDNISEPLVLE